MSTRAIRSRQAFSWLAALAVVAVGCAPPRSMRRTPVTSPVVKVTRPAVDVPPPVPTAPPEDEAPPPVPTRELARRLLETRDLALYDAARGAVVYADAWTEEGNGSGVRVDELVGAGRTTLSQVNPEDDVSEAASEARLQLLATALEGSAWQRLELVRWEDSRAPLSVPALNAVATLTFPRLTVQSPLGSATTELATPATPHVPAPGGIYAAEGVPVVVVVVWFDPGEHYGEGYNHFSEHIVLSLR